MASSSSIDMSNSAAAAAASLSASLASVLAAGSSTSIPLLSSGSLATPTGTGIQAGGTTTTPRATTGANALSDGEGGSSSTKIVVPIVVVAAVLAFAAIGWTLWRRKQKQGGGAYNRRMRPIDYEPSPGMPAAFAIGGASAGAGYGRRRGESFESFEAGRPMSAVMEEHHEYDDERYGPPMQEVGAPAPAPFQAIGGAASGSSRLRNYGREHEDNYYDGSSRVGYSSTAARGMDAATADSAAGRSYSPYADVHRAGSTSPLSDDDRYPHDPFADASSKRWSG